MKWRVAKTFSKSLGSHQGSIYITHKELVSKLGKPWGPSSDGKIRNQWIIAFDDETVATIYDWKEMAPPEKIKVWNIGGSSKALIYVHAIMGKTHEAVRVAFGEKL